MVLLYAGALPAWAATLMVTSPYDDNNSGTLRNTIGAAGDADTIKFSVTGTIRLTNASGVLGIGKNLTLSGPGATTLSISGINNHRVFNISSAITVNLSGLTVQDGVVRGASGVSGTVGSPGTAGGDSPGGGGILNQGTLNLTDCVIRNNSAFGGGGGNGDPPAPGGAAQGGGILNQGTLNLTNCVLRSNTVLGGGGGTSLANGNVPITYHGAPAGAGAGGAIENLGMLNVTRCSLSNNVAGGGRGGDAANYAPNNTFPSWWGGNGGAASGGSIANQGTLTLRDCTLQANQANGGAQGTGHGGPFSAVGPGNGGSANGGAITNHSSLTLINCVFNNNSCLGGSGGFADGNGMVGGTGGGGIGGAIVSESALNVTNCTLSSNSIGGGQGGIPSGRGGNGTGGGIASFDVVQLTACTLYANSASAGSSGGGGSTHDGSANGGGLFQRGSQAYLRNTIIAGDTINGTFGFSSGPDVSGTANTTSQGYNLIGDTEGNIGWLAASDVSDINPLLGPLQDNGGLTFTMALLPTSPALDAGDDALASSLAADQRGAPRPLGAHVDIGAYEAGCYPVANNEDNGPGSLRQAIQVAPLNDPICFGPDVTTIVLTNGQITISGTRPKILGPTNHGVTVSGNNSSRVLNISISSTVTICNLTIRDGSVTGASGGNNQDGASVMGGGILNQGTITLLNCTLQNNSALGGGGGDSGLIAGYGGYGLGGGAANLGTMSLTDCTLATNLASGGYGGNGVVFGVGGNGGAASGGGLYNQGTLRLNSCTLNGNSAAGGAGGTGFGNGFIGAGSGGGIYQTNGLGTTTVGNTIIAGDTVTGGSATAAPDFAGSATTLRYNLIGITNGSRGWFSTPGRSVDFQGTLASPIDPKLGPLEDNGGPTFTMSPLASSPALDTGNRGLPTDQRGFSSPVDLPGYSGGSDRGAVEVQFFSIDIGLRVHDGAGVIKIAAEPAGTLTSPLRIHKNGTTYGIVLVPTSSRAASKFRVQTSSGVKAMAKLP